jgi:hypothetical protein
MNFIKFIVSLILFKLLYHFFFSIIILPCFPFISLTAWAQEGKKILAKMILLAPIAIGVFIFGNLVPVFVFSTGVFIITGFFVETASYPWIYIVLGGLWCLFISAPNGEANIVGILMSIAFYICHMTIFKNMMDAIIMVSVIISLAWIVISLATLIALSVRVFWWHIHCAKKRGFFKI